MTNMVIWVNQVDEKTPNIQTFVVVIYIQWSLSKYNARIFQYFLCTDVPHTTILIF